MKWRTIEDRFKRVRRLNDSELKKLASFQTKSGTNLLHHACLWCTNEKLFKRIVEASENVNAKDRNGITPFQYLLQSQLRNRNQFIRALLLLSARGANPHMRSRMRPGVAEAFTTQEQQYINVQHLFSAIQMFTTTERESLSQILIENFTEAERRIRLLSALFISAMFLTPFNIKESGFQTL